MSAAIRCRLADGAVHVGADREPPQHAIGIDQAGGLGDAARRAVGPDHDIGTQPLPTREPDSIVCNIDGYRLHRPPREVLGAGPPLVRTAT